MAISQLLKYSRTLLVVCLSTSSVLASLSVAIAQSPSTKPGAKDSDNARLVFDFPCGFAAKPTQVGPTHWTLQCTPNTEFFFCFRLEGVAGRTVQIDFKGVALDHWRTLNPLYSYASNIDDPTVTAPIDDGAAEPGKARNNAIIPATTGQNWHYIQNVTTAEQDKTLTIEQKFTQDQVYVAMKYPYTPAGSVKRMETLATNSNVRLVEVGKSRMGRPLQVVAIGPKSPAAAKHGIVIYAGEHSQEEDSGWAAEGAIEFLAGDTLEAQEIRSQCAFLIIPCLDPDAAAMARPTGICSQFGLNPSNGNQTSPEVLAYVEFFKGWIDKGGRIDLVFDILNLESKEGPHIILPCIEPSHVEEIKALNAYLVNEAERSVVMQFDLSAQINELWHALCLTGHA